ncbi:hypothetical protein AHF37_05823 [Paragonimus kellicotti]|nr:hypothetical protein AHF37_05823 [Paragonimus kellicotti]
MKHVTFLVDSFVLPASPEELEYSNSGCLGNLHFNPYITAAWFLETLYRVLPENPVALGVFCHTLIMKLGIAADLIRCMHMEFMDIHTRPYVQAVVVLHKSTRYWDQLQMTGNLLQIAQALNDGTSRNLFNVRLRRRAKYTDDTL